LLTGSLIGSRLDIRAARLRLCSALKLLNSCQMKFDSGIESLSIGRANFSASFMSHDKDSYATD
jgi:hypothetical protein